MHKHAQLDSLRWIAAFCVGMAHGFQCFYVDTGAFKMPHGLGTMVFNGQYAVVFFFVLSGFVLVNATSALTFKSYTGFVVRRVLRIYPAAWVSLLIAAVAVVIAAQLPVYGLPWMSPWALELLQLPDGTMRSVSGELSLATHHVNPTLWSIAVEMVASILYPLMVFVMRRSVLAYGGLCLGAMIASSLIVSDLSLSTSGHYLYMFMVGAALNLLKPGFLSARSGGYLLVGAVILAFLARLLSFHTADFIFALSAAVIIAVVAFACPVPLHAWLGNRKFLLLGRCSYSYYLLNPAVLFILIHLYPMLGIAPPVTKIEYTVYALLIGAVAALCTIPLAHAMASTVERLSIKVGRNAERLIVAAPSALRSA